MDIIQRRRKEYKNILDIERTILFHSITYKRNYKALSLGVLSFIIPDGSLFLLLGLLLSNPIPLKYRIRNKIKEVGEWLKCL